jgi:succinyl-CoA synthetase beta subunit
MTAGSRLRVLLVNIFAGITDLGEFASLLGQALEAVPALRVPVVARLVGPGLDAAREQLAARGIEVETDLDRAVARVRERLGEPCA